MRGLLLLPLPQLRLQMLGLLLQRQREHMLGLPLLPPLLLLHPLWRPFRAGIVVPVEADPAGGGGCSGVRSAAGLRT